MQLLLALVCLASLAAATPATATSEPHFSSSPCAVDAREYLSLTDEPCEQGVVDDASHAVLLQGRRPVGSAAATGPVTLPGVVRTAHAPLLLSQLPRPPTASGSAAFTTSVSRRGPPISGE